MTKKDKKEIRMWLKMDRPMKTIHSKNEYSYPAKIYNIVGSEGNHNTRTFVDLALKTFREIINA